MTTSPIGTERELPRPKGMMQKVQRWSQPFWTCTKARVRPLETVDEVQRGFTHAHDVVDAGLLLGGHAEIGDCLIGGFGELVGIADH